MILDGRCKITTLFGYPTYCDNREATRGSPLLSVIGIKTTPNYAILRSFLATGTLYLLPKSLLRQKYNRLTRQCQGRVSIFAVGILAANTKSRLQENILELHN